MLGDISHWGYGYYITSIPIDFVYLVFKENILIATLLKRGNKNVDIKFSAHERFWNNLNQVAQDQKIGKPNYLIVLGAQYLWVLMLCRKLSV
jgi:hypothetical protein